MNKNVVILLTVGLVLAVYFIFLSNPDKITNYPSSGKNVIAFGDSLVAGEGSSAGNDFVTILSTRLGKPIINLGKNGDTTRDGLTRLDSVLSKDPKIVLVLLGGNDYLRKIPKEETFANLGTMIESIQNAGAVVILLGVRGGVLKDNYETDYSLLAEEYNTAYVPDVLDGIFAHTNLMSDAIHPNDAGYKIIAEKIYPVLKNLLE